MKKLICISLLLLAVILAAGADADLTPLIGTWVNTEYNPTRKIPKIVYKARHINDCFAAFDLLSEADCPAIVFAMGQAGQISRILAKKFGAFLTFASLDETSASAPGQISIKQMKTTYRWDHLNAKTEVFGLVGNPVGHSLSPVLFNACFDANEINAVYLPSLVEGDRQEFNTFMKNVSSRSQMGFGGFSSRVCAGWSR